MIAKILDATIFILDGMMEILYYISEGLENVIWRIEAMQYEHSKRKK